MNIAQEMEKLISDTTIWVPKTLKANTILLHQGGEISHNYYIKSGIIKVYSDETGDNAIINLLSDKMFLPFDNFSNKISFVNMKTLEKTDLYAVSDTNYRQLRENNPVFDKIVKQGLYEMMTSITYRTLVLLGKDAIDKYKIALKHFPCLLRMSNVEVAHFINITPERLGTIKPIVLKEIAEEKQNKGKNGNIST